MKLTKSAVALSTLRAQTQISIKEWSMPTVEYYSAVKRARKITNVEDPKCLLGTEGSREHRAMVHREPCGSGV